MLNFIRNSKPALESDVCVSSYLTVELGSSRYSGFLPTLGTVNILSLF